MSMNRTTKERTAWGLAAAMAAMVAGPVAAQSDRQNDKNTNRSVGIGLGAGAVVEALRGRGTRALILGAGAAYAGKKYEDARKAQRKDNARRARYSMYRPIRVVVNEERVQFPDQGPQMVANNVYVPLRGVLEEMGAEVRWNPRNRTVVASHEGKTVRLPANGVTTVNGREVSTNTPAFVEDGRVMVPLRFMAETFGADVKWNQDNRTVRINSNA